MFAHKKVEEGGSIVRTKEDLDFALETDLFPITSTPPYFAETSGKDLITIVGGAPDTFDYDPVFALDNPWIETRKVGEEGAKFLTYQGLRGRVWEELAQLERRFKQAGFNNFVLLPAYVPGVQSWIFINNAMSVGFNADGEPFFYSGKMVNDLRKAEPGLVRYYLQQFHLIDGFKTGKARNYTMEGKGDQLPMSLPILENGKQTDQFYHVIINTSGRRTNTDALIEYSQQSKNYVIEIPLSSDPVTGAYHGNVAIFYYQQKDGTRGVTYVPEMLAPEGRDFTKYIFRKFFSEENVHTITKEDGELYTEALKGLSPNVIAVGAGKIIASKNNPKMIEFLTDKLGMDVLDVDMQAICLDGGGLQCCYTALNPQPLNIIHTAKYLCGEK